MNTPALTSTSREASYAPPFGELSDLTHTYDTHAKHLLEKQ